MFLQKMSTYVHMDICMYLPMQVYTDPADMAARTCIHSEKKCKLLKNTYN